MPYVHCACGLTYDVSEKETACPKCGAAAPGVIGVPEAKIRFACPCGARLSSTKGFIGRSIDCPACGKSNVVPAASNVADTARAAPAARTTVRNAAGPRPPSRPDGWRSIARWSLLVALVPLALYTFSAPDNPRERLQRAIKEHPELVKKLKGRNATEKNFIDLLPGHRIQGAALSQSTGAHWLLALITALVFWEFILIIQPMGNSTSRQLWAVGIFTGTVGILMLLIVQFAAVLSTVIPGVGCIAVVFVALKVIGYSYAAAMMPDTGFLASMIGFTLGVGFCEELCKALPLFWHFRRKSTLDVRGAVVWGLATGIGFGVSEGISYSSSFYNGIFGGGIYIVRFISCVALHAVWSATGAILIWQRQGQFQDLDRWYRWFPSIFQTLAISMVLHGFYDTCLKKDMAVASLAGAALSFALFFWLYDRACRQELRGGSALAQA